MRKQYDWTAEAHQTLTELCSAPGGLSAATIALEISIRHGINPPISKASVIGRARREGIALPTPGAKRRPPGETPEAPPGSSVVIRPRPTHYPLPRFSRRVEIIPETGEPGLFLLNASEGDCRRPLGDPGVGQMHLLRVCAEPVDAGSSYCPACRRALYPLASSEAGKAILNEIAASTEIRTKKEPCHENPYAE